jgi:hypothetical protein
VQVPVAILDRYSWHPRDHHARATPARVSLDSVTPSSIFPEFERCCCVCSFSQSKIEWECNNGGRTPPRLRHRHIEERRPDSVPQGCGVQEPVLGVYLRPIDRFGLPGTLPMHVLSSCAIVHRNSRETETMCIVLHVFLDMAVLETTEALRGYEGTPRGR